MRGIHLVLASEMRPVGAEGNKNDDALLHVHLHKKLVN